jgi:hypothetical protein
MLSFEISAIDIVLAIGVMVLLLLYMNKFSVNFPEEKYFRKIAKKEMEQKNQPSDIEIRQFSDTTSEQMSEKAISHFSCPRGYGNIRKLGEDNSVSERCLGCYRLMECYSED